MPAAPISDPRILAGMARQVESRRALLTAGGRRLGWKAGFGAPAAIAKFGLDGPIVGFLMREAMIENGGSVSLKGWSKPIAEPEIAVYIGADLAPGADEATIRKGIAGLGAAIELVDLSFPPEDIDKVLAGNIFQRNVVLTPCVTSRAGGGLDGIASHVTRRGTETLATTTLEKNTGRVIDTVRRVADFAGQFYDGLKAGDVIIAGSVVAPILLDPDETAIAHRLDGIGEAKVRFTT